MISILLCITHPEPTVYGSGRLLRSPLLKLPLDYAMPWHMAIL